MSVLTQLDADATVGVISDTHGLLRPSAIEALHGSDLIVHAGDVGRPDVLTGLSAIAPVVAVRGNVDHGDWAMALPLSAVVALGGHTLYILHILAELGLDPKAAGFSAVIYGHSHKQDIAEKNGVTYFNSGSAGPRRFDLPASVGRLRIAGGKLAAELIPLDSA